MIRYISTIVFLCLGIATANAQQPHHSEIIVGHKGLTTLKSDIQYLLGLTTPEEQRQEENLLGIIEIMELGIDLDRPIRVDILSGMNPPGYIVSTGFLNADDLLENIEGAGFPTKESGGGLWELLAPDQGWLRLITKVKTAVLTFSTPQTHVLLRQLIQKITNPLPVVTPMLEGGANIAVQLTNKAQTAEDQKLRRASFAELRAVHMDTLQKRPSEAATQFAIRKQGSAGNLDEIERLLAEANVAGAKIVLDQKSGSAKILFNADAIAESSFAKTLAEFGQQEDRFGTVKKAEGAILFVRANHPLDEMRQGNMNKQVDLLEQDAIARMTKDTEMTADQKEAAGKLVKGVSTVTKDGISAGNINVFAQTVLDAEGEFITYGAITVKEGQRLDETLALIANTGEGNEIKPGVAKIGDITIHQVKFADGFFRPFDLVFEGKVGYIGTSKDLVWIGTGGESVLEPLKAAISDLKKPSMTENSLVIEGNLLPWVKRAKRVIEAEPEPTVADEQIMRRDRLRKLSLAVDAFVEKDDMSFAMSVKDGKADGEIFVNTGALRFVGKILADFSKNQLEE